MSVNEIVKLVDPPDEPLYGGDDEAWLRFEEEFPYELPKDFREYLEIYGKGCLGDIFNVFSPFYPSAKPRGKGNFLCSYNIVSPELIKDCEYSGWLESACGNGMPGLILFGGDTNENYLHWLTDGEPDQWPIVIGGGRSDLVTKHQGPFTSFFAKVLRHETATDRYSPDIVDRSFRNYPPKRNY